MNEIDYRIHGESQNLLKSKGVKSSFQRLLILEYIMKENNHPSAEMIYKKIFKDIPTLSRTTIYNTLNLFVKKGILTNLKTIDSEARYDLVVKPHAHFHCNECSKIIDLILETPLYSKNFIQGHQTDEIQIHFKGVCKNCLKQKKDIKK